MVCGIGLWTRSYLMLLPLTILLVLGATRLLDWKKAIEQNGRKLADTVKVRIVEELAKRDNKNADDLPDAEWAKYGAGLTIDVPESGNWMRGEVIVPRCESVST